MTAATKNGRGLRKPRRTARLGTPALQPSRSDAATRPLPVVQAEERHNLQCETRGCPRPKGHTGLCWFLPEETQPRPASIPQEWVELYLTVADICDGAEFDGEYQDLLNSAYQKIFNTPLGQRLYKEAVEEGSAFLRTVYGD